MKRSIVHWLFFFLAEICLFSCQRCFVQESKHFLSQFPSLSHVMKWETRITHYMALTFFYCFLFFPLIRNSVFGRFLEIELRYFKELKILLSNIGFWFLWYGKRFACAGLVTKENIWTATTYKSESTVWFGFKVGNFIENIDSVFK